MQSHRFPDALSRERKFVQAQTCRVADSVGESHTGQPLGGFRNTEEAIARTIDDVDLDGMRHIAEAKDRIC